MESGLYQQVLLEPTVESFGGAQRCSLWLQQHPQPSLLSVGFLGFWPASRTLAKGLSSPVSKYLLLAKLDLPGETSELSPTLLEVPVPCNWDLQPPCCPPSHFAAYASWEFLGVGTVPHPAEMVSVWLKDSAKARVREMSGKSTCGMSVRMWADVVRG